MSSSDKDALVLLRANSEEGFKLLFDKYWNDLYKLALSKLPAPEEAGDIVQDLFLNIWANRQQMEVVDSLFPYLYTSLKNRIYNHYAKNKTRLQYAIELQASFVNAANDVAEKLASDELKKIIEEAVASLPEKMQLVFRLNKEKQMSPSEIAGQLSLSVQTVKNQLQKANDKVRHYISSRIEPALLGVILLMVNQK